MKYYNLNKDNQLVLSEDKIYNKSELIGFFLETLDKQNIDYEVINKQRVPYLFKMFINEQRYYCYVYLKNITGAGWVNKPEIKRVQITNPSHDLNLNENENSIVLILGYYNFDDNPIWVAWDTQRYLQHQTLRSCYVIINNLKRGYINNYLEAVDSSQKIWLFKNGHIKRFLIDYITQT